MSASGPACVKTPTNRVFMGTKMSPRATIVDSRAFCKADVSIELSKFEFSHSLGRLQSFKMMLARGRASKDGELEESTLSRLEVWEESNLGKSTLSEVKNQRGV